MRTNLRILSTAVLAVCAIAMTLALPTAEAAQSAPSVGYWFEFTKGTGQHDLILTPDAISSAVMQGLRAGGISAISNPSNVDAMVEADITESYEPELQSIRIVSGTLTLKAPRPGASNFEHPILLCQTGLQVWRTSTNTQDAARKIRDGIVQQAVQFAKQCRGQLNNL